MANIGSWVAGEETTASVMRRTAVMQWEKWLVEKDLYSSSRKVELLDSDIEAFAITYPGTELGEVIAHELFKELERIGARALCVVPPTDDVDGLYAVCGYLNPFTIEVVAT